MKGCLIRCHCCLLSVSKEAVHQCTKNYGYTACIVLNSSNSRYFIWLVNLFFLLCRREIISNDISSERSTAKNYRVLCIFLHFIFGQSNNLLTHYTHLASNNTFFLLAYARAKRAVTSVNKGLPRVSFVRFFMPFCELDLEQPKNEITTVLINEVMRKKQVKKRYITHFLRYYQNTLTLERKDL